MPQIHLTWLTAGIAAAVLVGVGALVSSSLRRRETGAAVREVGVVVGLFGLWMLVGHIVGHHPHGGYARGAAIWHVEQALRLAPERAWQQPLLDHRWLAATADYYYAYAHWLSVDVVLAWLWMRHRRDYAVTRAALVAFTGSCLVLHLVSTAPPRLLVETRVVDVAAALGQSVYLDSPGISDHLSAMPSIHVGWAVLFVLAAWPTGSTVARLLTAAHAGLTSYVVIATGNHFWLDGAVAAALAAVAVAVSRFVVAAWQDAGRGGAAVGLGVGADPACRGGETPRARRRDAPAPRNPAPRDDGRDPAAA